MHRPFTSSPSDQVSSLRETKLLQRIRAWLGDAMPPEPYGMGDDCAIIPAHAGEINLATTDALIFGRHFDESLAPEHVGAKLLKRNLSDIAAMAGIPKVAVVSLILPPRMSINYLERMHLGLSRSAQKHRVAIAGGDISGSSDELFGSVLTLWGFARNPVRRTGSLPGDFILITGALGGSLSGKHYTFEPRLREGRWLAQHAQVHAMIDVTDGLAKDLPALLPHGCAAELHSSALPLCPECVETAANSGKSPLLHALCDGEDYELLLTLSDKEAPGALIQRFNTHFKTKLTLIGRVTRQTDDTPDSRLVDLDSNFDLSEISGYEHFTGA